jgi:hypothetical protein
MSGLDFIKLQVFCFASVLIPEAQSSEPVPILVNHGRAL